MAINLENAAIKALAKLESMSTEELVAEVTSNIQEPLAVSIRELGYLNNEKQFQFMDAQVYNVSTKELHYKSLNENSYKSIEAANVDKYSSLLAS